MFHRIRFDVAHSRRFDEAKAKRLEDFALQHQDKYSILVPGRDLCSVPEVSTWHVDALVSDFLAVDQPPQ